MLDMASRRTYPTSADERPAWLRQLPGYADLAPMLHDSAPPGAKGDWQVQMTVPQELGTYDEILDPLVMLAVLAFGAARVEEKLTEVVQVCRAAGKSWTLIGEALGMTKQAAWERFSGED
ncbi:MAG: ATP-dependent protease Clp ATPase subunit-like protein [Actinomycetia bacterium]|nr:ATP-dependent protease Clp ATPase subunit-like protein [Actinomycetes bacterium]